MNSQLRHLVADALYPTKAYSLPAVCERYGLEPGESDEAFSSKTRYVMRQLEKLSDQAVLAVAKSIVRKRLVWGALRVRGGLAVTAHPVGILA